MLNFIGFIIDYVIVKETSLMVYIFVKLNIYTTLAYINTLLNHYNKMLE